MSGILSFLRPALAAVAFCFAATNSFGQSAFLDFNTTGQYTNNFNVWQDNNGANGGAYAFTENTDRLVPPALRFCA